MESVGPVKNRIWSKPAPTRIAYSWWPCYSLKHRRSRGTCHAISTTTATPRFRQFLSVHPDAGEVIRGTGGIRKVRWGMAGRGKRGGGRVVYYWVAEEDHILSAHSVRQGRQG